jgi:hypothetical protein
MFIWSAGRNFVYHIMFRHYDGCGNRDKPIRCYDSLMWFINYEYKSAWVPVLVRYKINVQSIIS